MSFCLRPGAPRSSRGAVWALYDQVVSPDSCLTGLQNPPHSATQIRTGRVREVIVGDVLAHQQVIDKTKTLLRSFASGNSHCAAMYGNRGWLNSKQPVVEQVIRRQSVDAAEELSA